EKLMKIKGLVLVLTSALLFTGCQTVTQGTTKMGDWMEKSSLNEYEQITHKGIRDKFLWIEQQENGRKRVQLAKPLIAAKFSIEKRNVNSLFLVHYVNHEANFIE